VQIEVEETGDVQISPPEAAMHLYRIAQEAVANAVRHGGAQSVHIKIAGGVESIVLTVVDDGKGFPIHPRKDGGMGMRTMREDGIRKVLSGMTTAEEVISATMGDKE
jgi:signal transduction histidine kinase